MEMKLLETKILKGRVLVETGLHIGGGNDAMEIGGMDNPVIRMPHTGEPYIPGSSLKGKMRALMEWKLGRLSSNGAVHNCEEPECPVCRVFGSAKGGEKRGPTRLVVRDAILTEKSQQDFRDGKAVIEEKHENSINRITAKANPRPLERVVPGTEFTLEILYKVIDTGDEGKTDRKNFNEVVKAALRMVEEDCLGGHGSRGSGKVSFKNLEVVGENAATLSEG
jgi:CRISPR-associated protein Csm3